jgi:hypothetical protein
MNEQLKLTFHPSFHPSLDFTLKIGKDTGVLSYRKYDQGNPLMNAPFTAGYDIFNCEVGGDAYLKFVETIRGVNFNDHKRPLREGVVLDGIKISVEYISISSDTVRLDFYTPHRETCGMEYKLFDGFFEFAESVLEKENRLEYIRDLKSYFD